MADQERHYELVLMLDSGLEEAERDRLANEAKSSIEKGGSVLNEDNWGVREMAYQIDHKGDADYRWYRFSSGNEVLEELDHNLTIADGVVRFRVFEVEPDSPILPAPPETAVVMAPTGDDDERRGRRGRR
ncbi:MAG: 30S ribosomal protein S6 [Solirubrobacterales bacterium]